MMTVRVFKHEELEMTVELINHEWMVCERPLRTQDWKPSSGPYDTMGAAIDFIMALQEGHHEEHPA